MQQHPFVQDLNNGLIFPSQNVPLSRKTESWGKSNMDALESIARIQFAQKQRLYNNYKLINGELIESDYIDADGNFNTEAGSDDNDFLTYVAEKVALPGFVKNYDIIGQPVRTLEGEMDAFPDVFNVVGKGEAFDNERLRVKTEMLQEWFMSIINSSINEKLGYESTPEFENEEEAQAYQEQVQALTPPEIERYMSQSYRHVLEQWGQNELEDQFERFKIKAKRREEFHHYLVAGERFRHLYVSERGLEIESTNPIYTFSLKSPGQPFVQDGHIAGVIHILSVAATIDRFGHKMTDAQINSLEAPYASNRDRMDLGKHVDGSPITYLSPQGVPYQTRLPSLDPEFNKHFPNMMSTTAGGSVASFLTEEELSKINGQGTPGLFSHAGNNFLVITEGYWRSQQRIGKLTTWNEEIQDVEITIVDENYVVPAHIKQIRNKPRDFDGGINTLVWTRKTQIWQGIKINNYNSTGVMREPIYLDIKPADIQIGKLPIAGQFANNINTKPTSLVDRIKPWQFFFNVLMNQCYHFFETEIAPFLLMSADMLPNQKDWGGEDGLTKWLNAAKTGIGVIDLSPTSNGIAQGGQFPKVIDLDMGNRILSRMQLAMYIKQFALEQVGISPQRLGEVKPQETATGIAEGINNSHTQTSGWFTSFFECEKDILQMQLDAAKMLQSSGRELTAQNVKSDLSIQAIKVSMEDGYLYDLHLYVVDSQKELRNIEFAKRMAIENNTSEMMMSDRITMGTMNSTKGIIDYLKNSEKEAIARQQQSIALEQQKLEQQGYAAEEANRIAQDNFAKQLANNIEVAIIRALGNSRDNDIDKDAQSDVLEYASTLNAAQQIENTNNFNNAKLQLERDKQKDQQEIERMKARTAERKMISDQILADKKIKDAKIRGDKSK